MIRLEHLEYVYGLLVIPVLMLLFYLTVRWKKHRLKNFSDPDLLTLLNPEHSGASTTLKNFFFILAIIFLVLGIANPQIGSKMEEVKREGVDVMIALDISNSMKTEDIAPNRLARAKQSISRFVDKLQNDRVGIIIFAGNAYVQLPLTTDYGAAKLFASIIESDMIPTQGTAIGSAIDLSMKSFMAEDTKHKALIILTDGENHEDDAISAAKEAAEKGVVIHTVGMGSPGGAPIPSSRGYRKDSDGNTVISKLDATLLQQIAVAGNGKFIRATSSEGLETLSEDISKMEKKNFGMKMYSDFEDRFQYFIAAALLFLFAELFISEKKSRLLGKVRLFETK